MVEEQTPGRAASPADAAAGAESSGGDAVQKRLHRQASTLRLTLIRGTATSLDSEPSPTHSLHASHSPNAASVGSTSRRVGSSGSIVLPRPHGAAATSHLHRASSPNMWDVADHIHAGSDAAEAPGSPLGGRHGTGHVSYSRIDSFPGGSHSLGATPPRTSTATPTLTAPGSPSMRPHAAGSPRAPLSRAASHRLPSRQASVRISGVVPTMVMGAGGGVPSGLGAAMAAANLINAPSSKLQQKVAAIRQNPSALIPDPEHDPNSQSGDTIPDTAGAMSSTGAATRPSINFAADVAGPAAGSVPAVVGAPALGRSQSMRREALSAGGPASVSQRESAAAQLPDAVPPGSGGGAVGAEAAAAVAGEAPQQEEAAAAKKPWRFPALSWAMQEMQEQAVLAQAMAQAYVASRPLRSWRTDGDGAEDEEEEEEEGEDGDMFADDGDGLGELVGAGQDASASLSQRMSQAKLRVSLAGGALMAELSRRSLMKGPSCLDSSHLGSLAGHSVASGASLRTFSRAAGRDGVAVPVVVAQPETGPPPRRPPPDLVSVSDIPDDTLRALFKEVQQYGVHESVADALHRLSDDALRAVYARASRRLEHLPAAVVKTGAGGRLIVPLPGPRGVPGWDVGAYGNPYPSEKRRIGRYLGMSPGARGVLRQLRELEEANDSAEIGLEEDPSLVALWRSLGGKRLRHTRLRPHAPAAPYSRSGTSRRRGSPSRRSSSLSPTRRVSLNGGMFLKGTQGGFGFGVGLTNRRSNASFATSKGPSRRPTQDGQRLVGDGRRPTVDGRRPTSAGTGGLGSQGRASFGVGAGAGLGGSALSRRTTRDGGAAGARNKTRVARTLGGGVLGAPDSNYYDSFKSQVAALARAPPPPDSHPLFMGRSAGAPSHRSFASRQADGESSTDEEEEVEDLFRHKGPLLGKGSEGERKRALAALVDALQRAAHHDSPRASPTPGHEGARGGREGEDDYGFCPSSDGSAGKEWSYLAGGSDVSWDSWDGPRSEGEGEEGEEDGDLPVLAQPGMVVGGSGLLAALKGLVAAQRTTTASQEQQGAEPQVVASSAGPTPRRAGNQPSDNGLGNVQQSSGPAATGRPGDSTQQGVGQEGEFEDHELEHAFTLLADALASGRRPKVRRRQVAGEAPQHRTFRQAAAAVRTGARLAGTRRVRMSVMGVAGGSESGAAGSLFGTAAAPRESYVGGRVTPPGHELVGQFVDRWVCGAESGDTAVMSIDRLKEALVAGADKRGDEPRGDGAIGAVSRARVREWGPEMAAFIPERVDSREAGTGNEDGMHPALMRAASMAASVAPGAGAGGLRHALSSASLGAAAAAAAAAVGVPGRSSPTPGDEELAAGGRSRRASVRAALAGAGNDAEPAEPRVAPKTVARRIAQAQAVGSPLLDLALAPHLGRADLGVVYQALLGAPCITHLRARDGVLTGGGVAGLLALLRACPFLRELDVSCTPAFGPDAAEQLGDALHPRHRLALTALQLQGCPIQDEGFMGLALGLQFNTTLRSLGLAGCGLGDGGLGALDQVLEQNVVLSALDLSANSFSERGVACLAADLRGNIAVRELRLRGCGLGDGAAAELAGMLCDAQALQVLDLSGNAITAKGALALAGALRRLEGADDPTQAAAAIASAPGTSAPALVQQPTFVRRAQARARSPVGASQLHTLLLCDNPLGRAGVVLLLQALDTLSRPPPTTTLSSSPATSTSGSHSRRGPCALRRLGLDGVATGSRVGEGRGLVGFDPARPNGTYVLDLAVKEDRQVAEALSQLWASSHGRAWLTASLDGHPLKLPHPPDVLPPDPRAAQDAAPQPAGSSSSTAGSGAKSAAKGGAAASAAGDGAGAKAAAAKGGKGAPGAKKNGVGGAGGSGAVQSPALKGSPFPDGLPQEGILKVGVMRCAAVERNACPHMGPVLEACILSQLRSDRASEVWKAQLVACLTNVAFVTSDQAARILSHFSYRLEKVDAASLLLSACTDVWRLLPRLLQPPSHPPLAPRDPALDNAPCVVEDEPHATATAATAARSAGRASEGSGVLVQEAQRAEPGVSGGAGGRRKGLAGKKGVHYSGKPAMMDDDIMELIKGDGLQLCTLTPGFVQLALGWHGAASGRYRLNLGVQTQRLLAALLLDAAHEQQQAPWPTTNPDSSASASATAPHPNRPALIGVPGACLRNVALNGQQLGAMSMAQVLEGPWAPPPHMEACTLPAAGLLEFDFVNPGGVRPRTHPHLLPPPPVVPGTHAHAPWEHAKRKAAAMRAWLHAAPPPAAVVPYAPNSVRSSRTNTGSSTVSSGIARASPLPSGSSVPSMTPGSAALSGSPAAGHSPHRSPLGSVGEEGQPPAAGPHPHGHGPHAHGHAHVSGQHHVGFSAHHHGPQPTGATGVSAVGSSGVVAVAVGPPKRTGPVPLRVRRAREMTAELGAAWEGLFVSLLQVLGLSGHDPRLAGWLHAAHAWGPEAQSDLSLALREEARARHDAYFALPVSSADAGEAAGAASDGGGGKKGKKGGKKGGKGKQSAKAAAKEAAAAAAASAAREQRISAAITAAGAALSAVVNHAVAHRVTSTQAIHTIRLLPSLRQRLDAAVALLPALWDPAGLVDIALALDAPVPITPSPPDTLLQGAPTRHPSDRRASHAEGNIVQPTFPHPDAAAGPGVRASGSNVRVSDEQPGAAAQGPGSPSKAGGGGGNGLGGHGKRSLSHTGEGAPVSELLTPPPRGWVAPPPPQPLPGADDTSAAAADGGKGGKAGGAKAKGPAGSKATAGKVSASGSAAGSKGSGVGASREGSKSGVGSMSGAAARAASPSSGAAAGAEAGAAPDAAHPAGNSTSAGGLLTPLAAAGSQATWAVLSLLASRIGWCSLRLHWAAPGTLDGVIMEWDLSQPEQVVAAMRVCRWADRAPGALAAAATNAGRLALEHGTGWGYWEQVLGWACWRPGGEAATAATATATAGPQEAGATAATAAAGPAVVGQDQGAGGKKKSVSGAGAAAAAPQVVAQHPRLGVLQVVLAVSEGSRAESAATFIQSVWRGRRMRCAVARALRDEAARDALGGACLGRRRTRGALDPGLIARHLQPQAVSRQVSGGQSSARASLSPGLSGSGGALQAHGSGSGGSGSLERQVPISVPARWQGAWAMVKYLRRVARLQALGLGLSLSHAAREMAANADHLFPLAPPAAAEVAPEQLHDGL